MRGRLDWLLVGSAMALLLVGTAAILSSASPMPHFAQILQRHFLAMCLGTLAFLFGLGFNYQIFQDQSRILYALTLVLMAAVLVAGVTIRGHKSWFRLPYFSFQPSELARIYTVLVLANYLDRRGGRIHQLPVFLGAFAVAAPVMLLILLEPDLASALTFLPVVLAMLFCAGAQMAHLTMIAAFGCLALFLPLLWTLCMVRPELVEGSGLLAYCVSISAFGLPLFLTLAGVFVLMYAAWRFMLIMRAHLPWYYFFVTALVLGTGLCAATFAHVHMKEHQRKRLVAFLVPELDPRGATYNVTQAQVAIGSGGVVGKGLFSGTQSQLGFLPERHTDFIYAVVGEEFGFMGTAAVLLLYLLLLWRIVCAGHLARDRYGFLVCSGLAAVFGFQMMINVGMCLGAVPVAGLPLPMVSYGGSSLVVSLWALGIVNNVYSKRYAFMQAHA